MDSLTDSRREISHRLSPRLREPNATVLSEYQQLLMVFSDGSSSQCTALATCSMFLSDTALDAKALHLWWSRRHIENNFLRDLRLAGHDFVPDLNYSLELRSDFNEEGQ